MNEWQKVKIGNFLKVREGKYKPDDDAIADLKRLNKIDFSGRIHLSDKPTKTDMIIVNSGDLVISGINVAKGAIAVHQGSEPITATIHYSAYEFDESKIDIDFLKRFLKSPAFISALQEQTKGGIKTEIKAKTLLSIVVQLPSLSEQKTINKRFDLFENELIELDSEISNQQTYLTQLRQAILQEAIEGKLTADWRVKNPVQKGNPDHDAQALLAKIQVFWKENKTKSRAITNGQYIELLPELNSWIKTDIDSIGIVKIGGTPSRDNFAYWQKDVAWVSSGEVANCEIFDTREYISHEGSNNSAAKVLPCGSVLVAMIGQSKTRGQSAILRINAATNQNVCGIVINHGLINEKYLHYYFLSRYEESRTFAAGGNQPALNGAKIGKFLINLPPLAEQNAIVERVDRLLESVNALEQQVKERKSYAEQLMQVVLKEAFTR